MSEAKVHSFQAEVTQVLKLVVNSLYSHKEIFLRELVSNASDALDKLRFRSLSEPDLVSEGTEFAIQIAPDDAAKTLTISDNGVGMTEQELVDNLGTIARSGTRDFVDRLKQAQEQKDLQLIGQFGVGFYSAFLVADRVEVVTRAAGSDRAFRWTSDAQESFTVEETERDAPGTDIVLHLSEGNEEFLQGYRLRQLIGRYSDYVPHPILMPKVRLTSEDDEEKEDDGKEGDEKKEKLPELERVNQASALWRKNPKDVEKGQYEEFYKHLGHDWEAPLAYHHFRVEGTQMFSGLVFLPSRPPFDLFDSNAQHGVRLHVKRVFVMDNCEELLPKYLRFVKGLVDSEDLPLNVSREILQDSRMVRVIKKQVVNHSLQMIEELVEERPEDFEKFWKAFGAVLKEGLHYGAEDKERLAKLLRYESTTQEGLTSLADYVSRMKEGQKAIFYATGNDKKLLQSSPHLERLKKQGYEVLLMTDPVDAFAVSGLGEFDGKPLTSAMDEKLEIEDQQTEEEKQQSEAAKKEAESLLGRFKNVLSEKVSEVRASDRLTDSPVCLVIPEGGVDPHIERLMRAHNQNLPETKRILEVNPGHPVIKNLKIAHDTESSSEAVAEWIHLLYDQALIAEGSPVDDPAAFAQRLSHLMQSAALSSS
jgi:molecular chaperone HtpG